MAESNIKKATYSENEATRETHRYLKGYSVFRNLIENENNGNYSFGNPTISADFGLPMEQADENNDIFAEARIKMFEIRRFVTSLPSGDEKVFLFLRYIHGETLEECAERMNLSSRQIYRLQKSALLMAHQRLRDQANDQKTKCVE